MSENVAEYVLPLRRADREGETELLAYLQWLSERMEVTVVDGSDAALFRHLHERLPAGIRHIPPHRPGLNGKARGVMTAFDVARRERIVLADDDVRYDEDSLNALLARLESADLVRPQNVYASYPWHAQWDTARMLVGRAFGGDYGGTVGVRRSAVRRAGGYSTDVLFENLELERTVRIAGGRVEIARDLCVPRLPPTPSHFLRQRVRQAYDGFAQPARLLVELSLLPLVLASVRRRSWSALSALLVGGIAVAEYGRRTDGGAARIPAAGTLWTPVWMLERAVTAWMAVGLRLRGGVTYAGSRVGLAATPQRSLRRRLAHAGGQFDD
jgi:hypothetical protein